MGYARVTEDPDDRAEQKVELRHAGAQTIVLDPGRGLLADVIDRCTRGDALAVTALSRLAGSLAELREILLRLSANEVVLQIGDRTYDLRRSDQTLTEAVDLMASFEGDLAAARAAEERRAARVARVRRPGRRPKLSPGQERDIGRLYDQGYRTVEELAQDYGVGTSTVYRILARAADQPTTPNRSKVAAAMGDHLETRGRADARHSS